MVPFGRGDLARPVTNLGHYTRPFGALQRTTTRRGRWWTLQHSDIQRERARVMTETVMSPVFCNDLIFHGAEASHGGSRWFNPVPEVAVTEDSDARPKKYIPGWPGRPRTFFR